MNVSEQLKSLIELQQIDSKIVDIKIILDKVPLKLSESEIPFKKMQSILDSIKQKLSSLEKKKRDKERQLDDINDKINKLKARITELKTNKEYQAYLKEIESIEKERYSVEDEILIIMEEIDNTSRHIASEEEKLKKEKDKIDIFKKKLQDEKSELEKELATFREMRMKIAETLDIDLYNQYINLIETYNGLAVAEAENEICQGCNMNIPPQLFVELKKSEEIINCPQCRRILYYKNNK